MSHNVEGTGWTLRKVDFKVNGHTHVVNFLLNTPPPLPFDVTPSADVYVTDVHLLCDPMSIMYTCIFI